MGYQRPMLGNLPRPLGLWLCVFVCLASLFGAVRASAQDVAEAARQEKARKAAQGKPKSKVYTDEDLKKAQILTPEDRVRAEAAKKEKAPAIAPILPPTQSVDAESGPQQESLGEIARRYRREKEAREVELAKKTPSPSPYKMDLPNAALATPLAPNVVPVAPPALHPAPEKPVVRIAPGKRNPFSRPASSTAVSGSISAVAPSYVAPTNLAPRSSSPSVSNSSPKSKAIVRPDSRPKVTIQSGDSLWKLSRQYLGRGSRWHELAAVNPGLPDPTRIQPGSVVVIPQAEARVRAKPPTSVTVQKGDSLWKIAAALFGSGSQWSCLAQANPQLRDFNRIWPGQTITIPATCGVMP